MVSPEQLMAVIGKASPPILQLSEIKQLCRERQLEEDSTNLEVSAAGPAILSNLHQCLAL